MKIFGCSSGKVNEEDGERAFAEVFAQRMRNFNYHDCEFFGYAEDLRASGDVQAKTGHKYSHTKDLPGFATSYRNPSYAEEVVQRAMKQVQLGQARGKLDKYDVLLKEDQFREAEARLEEARVWYRDNEKRASEVRVQF